MFTWHVLESQFQAFRFSLKAAFGHSPLPTQSQCRGKKFLRCHPSYGVHGHPKCKSIPLFGLAPDQVYQQLLRLRDRSEERAQGYRTQNAVTFPARSEACSREKRNKWRGPTKWGGGCLCRIRP